METAFSIIAMGISVTSVIISLFTFMRTTDRDRKFATLEAYNRLQNEVFDNLNMLKPKEIRDICTDNKSARYKTISGYLARIEHFCVGINQDIYDRKTFYALAHGYFDDVQLLERIEPIIHAKNSGRNTGELFYNDTLSVLAWMKQEADKK